MAYSAALQTVYHHYLRSYSRHQTSRSDVKRAGELRSVYNAIVEQNRKAPLFLLENTKESYQFAVGLKENARELNNAIAAMGAQHEDGVLGLKQAYSSDADIVEATYIGEGDDSDPFEITVHRLAASQVNSGHMLPTDKRIGLPPGSYSFDLSIGETSYEFQFNINITDSNIAVQSRLARLFESTELGLTAIIVHDDHRSALRLETDSTGIITGREQRFTISDERSNRMVGAVSYLGLANMTQSAVNAEFTLNDELRSNPANRFVVKGAYELVLKGQSSVADGGDNTSMPVRVGLKDSVESLRENINHLIGSFNGFLETTGTFDGNHFRGRQAMGEMRIIAARHRDEIAALGIAVAEDGRLTWNESDDLRSTYANENDGADNSSMQSSLWAIKSFTKAIMQKTGQIALNPMEYVDKKIVAYKNPARSFANPYVTSAYSGLMFNFYC
ncbi:MAG: hypothetical protein LBC96_05170 [Lachnospiraceae bacterium]|jgi:flagellar hook-associated protein 2|nr:hypothetical protein [Lachnospiraceae bacterium]